MISVLFHFLDHLVNYFDLPIKVLRLFILYLFIRITFIVQLFIVLWLKVDLKQLYLVNQVLSFLFVAQYFDFCLLHFELKLAHSLFYSCFLFFSFILMRY